MRRDYLGFLDAYPDAMTRGNRLGHLTGSALVVDPSREADAEIALPSLSEIGYTGATGLDVPTLLRCLHRYQPESVILVPQLLLALVMAAEQGAPLPASLRYIAVGGGRVGPGLLQRARAHGRRIHHGRHMLDHQIPLYLEWFGIDAKGIDIVALVRSIGT